MASSDDLESVSIDEVEEYYRNTLSPQNRHLFKNLDDEANLEPLLTSLQSSNARNFLLDFSDTASWVCFDANTHTVDALLNADRPDALSTRWINVWHPSSQTSLLDLLAKHYDFSPRLLAFMCSGPREQRKDGSDNDQKPSSSRKRPRSTDTEFMVENGPDESSEGSSTTSYDSVSRNNLYRITNNLWHYSSIDFGRNYVYIGYNSLYGMPSSVNISANDPLPNCIRVWTWLVLCEDNTVISINEDPFPHSDGRLDAVQQIIFAETRRNLVSVFRSLSAVEETALMTKAPMSLLPIRTRLGDTPEETANRQKDIPGLLFYYLFENWQNRYNLITRKVSRYGLELSALRASMFASPTLAHIDHLDTIGKELGVLKRHYESYNRIIDRLLEPQPASTASVQNMAVNNEASQSQTSLSTIRPIPTNSQVGNQSALGVSLPTPARVRFRWLRDSIDLYALSEVEEFVKQKDNLVSMNFRLIAIKESLDVEKLTRITLLLMKFTILFLPISFLTSYFSVPLEGLSYGAREYWISFVVTLGLSWAALFVFGVVSGSVQTFSVFKALWKALKRMGRWVREKLVEHC
jgi:hypothetical protein